MSRLFPNLEKLKKKMDLCPACGNYGAKSEIMKANRFIDERTDESLKRQLSDAKSEIKKLKSQIKKTGS